MGLRAHRPTELKRSYFRGSEAISRGLLTRSQLRSSAWQPLFRDVYADADLRVTHLLKCRAAVLLLPPYAALTGRSAACLARLPLGEPNDLVQVIVPAGRQFQAQGMHVRRAWLPPTHVESGKPPVTVPQRTAWEIARGPDVIEAVTALDILFHYRYLRPGAMDSWVAAYPRSRAARALGLADGRAESPQESRTRVRLTLSGFPPPIPQYDVEAGGAFIARVDLAWPTARVAVEYDGGHHADFRQLSNDRVRLNKLVDAGWVVFHLTSRDLTDPERFARFTTQLRAALARAHMD